jgi:guanylate kinase
MTTFGDGHEPPILFILSGPSGAGKGSVMRALLARVPRLTKVVTYTTRPPRAGEIDGVDYHFVSVEQFLQLVQAGQIFEYELVYRDHYYGSPRELFTPGADAMMELDYKGREKYRRRHGPVVSIFVLPPSLAVLRQRILARSPEQNLAARLANAIEQVRHADRYDYIVKNEELGRCVDQVATIIAAERLRRSGRCAWAAMARELKEPD